MRGGEANVEVEGMFEVRLNPGQTRSVKESLLLLLCGISALAMIPLIFLRLRDDHWTLAFVEAVIVCIMLLLFVVVYMSRRTRTVGIFMALGFICVALMSALLLGVKELFWAFPALMVAFFMLDTRQATILTGGFVGCFLAIVWHQLPAIYLIKICLTLIVTVLLANAFSLTNRRQMDSLRRLAHVDPLTGAGNRRAQNIKLDAVNAMFQRNNSPVSLLIIDIDHFKAINDTYGHIRGDQLLVELCELLGRCTRASESLYRYGGEEFVLVAEHTALGSAMQLAQKLRSAIAQETLSSGIALTVSIGIAQLERKESREGWLGRADTALYRAKRNGRNQVVVAEPIKQALSVRSAASAACHAGNPYG
jgi:diguanylate cyclase (GGDEF)-like protein